MQNYAPTSILCIYLYTSSRYAKIFPNNVGLEILEIFRFVDISGQIYQNFNRKNM